MKYQKGFIGGSLSIFSLIGWIAMVVMSFGIYHGGKYVYNKLLEKDKEISQLETQMERNEAAFDAFRVSLMVSQKQKADLERQNESVIDESRKASNAIERADLGRQGAADPALVEELINESTKLQSQQFRDITARDWVPNEQELEELDKETKE